MDLRACLGVSGLCAILAGFLDLNGGFWAGWLQNILAFWNGPGGGEAQIRLREQNPFYMCPVVFKSCFYCLLVYLNLLLLFAGTLQPKHTS